MSYPLYTPPHHPPHPSPGDPEGGIGRRLPQHGVTACVGIDHGPRDRAICWAAAVGGHAATAPWRRCHG